MNFIDKVLKKSVYKDMDPADALREENTKRAIGARVFKQKKKKLKTIKKSRKINR